MEEMSMSFQVLKEASSFLCCWHSENQVVPLSAMTSTVPAKDHVNVNSELSVKTRKVHSKPVTTITNVPDVEM